MIFLKLLQTFFQKPVGVFFSKAQYSELKFILHFLLIFFILEGCSDCSSAPPAQKLYKYRVIHMYSTLMTMDFSTAAKGDYCLMFSIVVVFLTCGRPHLDTTVYTGHYQCGHLCEVHQWVYM